MIIFSVSTTEKEVGQVVTMATEHIVSIDYELNSLDRKEVTLHAVDGGRVKHHLSEGAIVALVKHLADHAEGETGVLRIVDGDVLVKETVRFPEPKRIGKEVDD